MEQEDASYNEIQQLDMTDVAEQTGRSSRFGEDYPFRFQSRYFLTILCNKPT